MNAHGTNTAHSAPESRKPMRRMNPLTGPRSSGTLSPKGARVANDNFGPRPLGGEGGERSEPGEGVLQRYAGTIREVARG